MAQNVAATFFLHRLRLPDWLYFPGSIQNAHYLKMPEPSENVLAYNRKKVRVEIKYKKKAKANYLDLSCNKKENSEIVLEPVIHGYPSSAPSGD